MQMPACGAARTCCALLLALYTFLCVLRNVRLPFRFMLNAASMCPSVSVVGYFA